MSHSICNRIKAARIYGAVRCGVLSGPTESLSELAKSFGLVDDVSNYREIDKVTAKRLLKQILHRDMAYRALIIPDEQADILTDEFLSQFPEDSRYFTASNPVTDATF